MGNDAWVGITAADGVRHLVVRTDIDRRLAAVTRTVVITKA
jgi:hypothetical protein